MILNMLQTLDVFFVCIPTLTQTTPNVQGTGNRPGLTVVAVAETGYYRLQSFLPCWISENRRMMSLISFHHPVSALCGCMKKRHGEHQEWYRVQRKVYLPKHNRNCCSTGLFACPPTRGWPLTQIRSGESLPKSGLLMWKCFKMTGVH